MPTATLAPWSDEHLSLLVEANTPAMTRYRGGPESESDLQDRHRRYLRAWNEGSAWMYAIEVDDEPAGGIGFWPIVPELPPVLRRCLLRTQKFEQT